MAAHPSGSAPGLDPARIMPATSTPQPEEESPLSRVAIFTDSASDLDPARPRPRRASAIVPLLVSFGSETFKAGVDLSTDGVLGADGRAGRAVPEDRGLVARASSRKPTRPPSTAGAEAIVSIHVAGTLSGTIKSAQIARDMLPDREIHVVDSLGASMAEGILARHGRRARRRRPVGGRDRRDPRGPGAGHAACTSPSRPSST